MKESESEEKNHRRWQNFTNIFTRPRKCDMAGVRLIDYK